MIFLASQVHIGKLSIVAAWNLHQCVPHSMEFGASFEQVRYKDKNIGTGWRSVTLVKKSSARFWISHKFISYSCSDFAGYVLCLVKLS